MSEHPPKTEENFDENLSYKETIETEIKYLENSHPTEPEEEKKRLEDISFLKSELSLLETHISEHKEKTGGRTEHKKEGRVGPFGRLWKSAAATTLRVVNLFGVLWHWMTLAGVNKIDYVSGKGGESHGGGGHGGGHGHDDHGGHGGGAHH